MNMNGRKLMKMSSIAYCFLILERKTSAIQILRKVELKIKNLTLPNLSKMANLFFINKIKGFLRNFVNVVPSPAI